MANTDILERLIERLEHACDTLESRVSSLELDSAKRAERFEAFSTKIDALMAETEELSGIVGKWRAGAVILFFLGAFAVWVFDNAATVKKFFFG